MLSLTSSLTIHDTVDPPTRRISGDEKELRDRNDALKGYNWLVPRSIVSGQSMPLVILRRFDGEAIVRPRATNASL